MGDLVLSTSKLSVLLKLLKFPIYIVGVICIVGIVYLHLAASNQLRFKYHFDRQPPLLKELNHLTSLLLPSEVFHSRNRDAIWQNMRGDGLV